MSIYVAITEGGRPNLAVLTRGWLLRGVLAGELPESHLRIFDDGTSPPTTKHDVLNARCAGQRRQAVDWFLGAAGPGDVLFMKDDDVLVAWPTVKEAAESLVWFSKMGHRMGAFTLFAPASFHLNRWFGEAAGVVYSDLHITGEAHVLFPYQALLEVGNHFDPRSPTGFADTQWAALASRGYRYFTQAHPSYQVQHLGIGPGGSRIHNGATPPFWCRRLYRSNDPRLPPEILRVAGFDVETFEKEALAIGGELAAKNWLEAEAKEQKDETQRPCE